MSERNKRLDVELKIRIPESVKNNLISSFKMKAAMGNAYGVVDEFLYLVTKALEEGKSDIEIQGVKKDVK